jgi:membrane protease YdiL (CAAX protease family)
MHLAANEWIAPPALVPSVELQPPAPPADELAAPPRPTPRITPGFWGALGWMLVVILVCQFLPGLVAGFWSAFAGVPFARLFLPALFGGQVLGALLALFLLRRRIGRGWMSELGLNRLPIVPTLLAILCVPGLKAACAGIAYLAQMLLGGQDHAAHLVMNATFSLPWWLCLLAIAVGPALNEELWFRGFLGRGLVGRYGPTIGILLTSFLFGVIHFNLIQGCYAFVLGLAAHLIYRATRSLWVPILVHFLFNGLAVVAVLLVSAAEKTADIGTTETAVAVAICGASLTLLVAASWGLYRLRVPAVG